MKTKIILVASVIAALSMGCSSKKKVVAPTPPPPTPAPAEPAPVKKVEAPEGHIKITGDHLIIDKKIHFGSDSDVIQEDSFELLDEMASVLKDHKEIAVLHIVGHTDSSGDDAHNMDLSKRRAAAVEKMLRDKGVEQTIDSKGAGETEPSCQEDTDECHEQNRRVEFIIEKTES